MTQPGRAAPRGARTITGRLSGKPILIPVDDGPPMPALGPSGVVHDGAAVRSVGWIDSARGYPDVKSFRRK